MPVVIKHLKRPEQYGLITGFVWFCDKRTAKQCRRFCVVDIADAVNQSFHVLNRMTSLAAV